MKKLLLAMTMLLAVGAGCMASQGGKNAVVDGKWSLAFDLPEGWVMVVPYQAPTSDVVVPSENVERLDNEVYLQSTAKAILSGGIGAEPEVPTDSYETLVGNSLMRVSRLDPRRLIPSEAEDLGDGFYKLKLCEDGEDCQIYSHYNYEYYLKTDAANYKFILVGDDVEQMIDVVMSAKVVNTAVPAE